MKSSGSQPLKAYLKCRYGFKNFGDEMLFFGVVDRIFTNYAIEKLVVEVGDVMRMQQRLDKNMFFVEKYYDRIHYVPIKQHRRKVLTHLCNMLGLGTYKKYFKFFGGGEVIHDETDRLHRGRNYLLLYGHSIRMRQFALLGGIGKPHRSSTKRLYKYMLPKAQKIVTREKDSYKVVLDIVKDQQQAILYTDFSESVIHRAISHIKNNSDFDAMKHIYENKVYILINLNSHINNPQSIKVIQNFCAKYPDKQKVYFPCDMHDDMPLYTTLTQHIPELKLYDRTKYSLLETLALFYYTTGGIGARLHFLYPLKLMHKTLHPLVYKDKVRKLILEE